MADTQPEAETSSRLEELTRKYGAKLQGSPGSARTQAHQAFDSQATYATDLSTLRRVSKGPQNSTTTTGNIHAEMAGIQLELAELAEEYGQLNVRMGKVFGKDKIYTLGDVAGVAYNSLIRNRKRVREIKVQATGRKGDALAYLVGQMSIVLEKQYQRAAEGKTKAEALQVENIAHMKNLDRKLIVNLRQGYRGSADYTAAEAEVAKLEGELKEIEDVLTDYEQQVQRARAGGEVDKIMKLTDEMSQVLDIKHGVLDGRLAAEGVVTEIRRSVLDSAEGVQSAKGAIAASKVNYRAINALTDSLSELEIKYRHAKEDMIPVFHIQGKIAAGGLNALQMRDTLIKVAGISQKLMEANSRLVMHLAAESFDLLQTPLYDPERARQTEERLREYMTDLNARKMQWAEQVQSVITDNTQPHYAQRT